MALVYRGEAGHSPGNVPLIPTSGAQKCCPTLECLCGTGRWMSTAGRFPPNHRKSIEALVVIKVFFSLLPEQRFSGGKKDWLAGK